MYLCQQQGALACGRGALCQALQPQRRLIALVVSPDALPRAAGGRCELMPQAQVYSPNTPAVC